MEQKAVDKGCTGCEVDETDAKLVSPKSRSRSSSPSSAVESELQSKVAELIGSVDETFPEILYNETDQMVATVPCGRWRCMEARHQTRESESRMCNMFFVYRRRWGISRWCVVDLEATTPIR